MAEGERTEHTERLWAPPSWWATAAVLVAAAWLVLVVSTPALVTAIGTLLTAVLVFGGLGAAGAVEVGIRRDEVVAGRAHVPLHVCGAIDPLDARATRAVRGPEADARAYLLLRPWVRQAVRIELCDPDDPTPYWLVSARHPERIAAAVVAARSVPGRPPT
ncbi:hypothetical protein BH20ACT6_BH20ACT6_10020 [soil metagenome]